MHYTYRKDIDGLRALAVLPVIFYHAGFKLFSGGFVGVDIFFVISGYLITNIILKDLSEKKFSIINFYERRARRILPALFTVILATSLLSYIFLTKSELGFYFQSVIATVFFFSNFYFWKNAPYFNSDSELQPLLHTWSLSIEEQFYIVFPIIMILLFRYFKRFIPQFLIIFLILSFSFCVWASNFTSGNLNFYFTLSRGWELALGSILSIYLGKKKIEIKKNRFSNLFSFLGLFLIFFSVFTFNKESTFPGILSLIPTTGASLIIIYGNKSGFAKKILTNQVFVFIGLVSYSFYLWHQPLLAFGSLFFENFNTILKIAAILISFLLSIFSWKYVEQAFRKKDKINLQIFTRNASAFILFILFFSLSSISIFNSKSFNSTEALMAKKLSEEPFIFSNRIDERQFIKNRIIFENNDIEALIVGSSRLMQVSNKIYKRKLLNLSVSGASLEDQITITEMALEKFDPEKIILGADPWLFNKFNGQNRWKSISDEYYQTLKNIDDFEKSKKLLDLNFELENKNPFVNLINQIYENINLRNLKLVPLNENNQIKQIIRNDGSRIYSKKDISHKVISQVINYSMEKYHFSDEKFKLYEKFINYLSLRYKKEIILVLSPYHSESYKLTLKKIPYYQDVEKKFIRLAKDKSIKLIGSYSMEKTECEDDEFYNGDHPKSSCMTKIFRQIK